LAAQGTEGHAAPFIASFRSRLRRPGHAWRDLGIVLAWNSATLCREAPFSGGGGGVLAIQNGRRSSRGSTSYRRDPSAGKVCAATSIAPGLQTMPASPHSRALELARRGGASFAHDLVDGTPARSPDARLRRGIARELSGCELGAAGAPTSPVSGVCDRPPSAPHLLSWMKGGDHGRRPTRTHGP
jgi:hypothetical protein